MSVVMLKGETEGMCWNRLVKAQEGRGGLSQRRKQMEYLNFLLTDKKRWNFLRDQGMQGGWNFKAFR